MFLSVKVRSEDLATRNVLFYGQKHYFKAMSTDIRSSITTRTVFDAESPLRPVILLVSIFLGQ